MKEMNGELIRIGQDQTVDARELHGFLEISTKFADWITRRIEEYGLIEGLDFTLLKIETQYNQIDRVEYKLKLDTAKELCMVEKNERGKQARKYFIEVEKKWKAQRPINGLLALQQTVAELVRLDGQAQEQAKRLDSMEDKMKLLASDSDYRTIRGLARVLKLDIPEKEAAKIGKHATAVCKAHGAMLGRVGDERHGQVNSYPIKYLEPIMRAWEDGRI